MNYLKLYESIVRNRQNTRFDGYTEKHHIMPRCLGGTDDNSNIVSLSAKEHFICHMLLTKIYEYNTAEWHKMIKAFMMMASCSKTQERYTSVSYSYFREHFSHTQRVAQTGAKNSQFCTMWIYNNDLKESKKVPKSKNPPEGWTIGRKLKFDVECNCAECNKIIKFKAKYCSNNCKITSMRKQRNLDMSLKKYTAVLDNLAKISQVIHGSVVQNECFITQALAKMIPKRIILKYIGCNDSGFNYNIINNF